MYVPNIRHADLFKLIREEDVYFTYLGYPPEPGEMYLSPFRQETAPSFGVFFKNKQLKWKDFGEDQERYDCMGFVMHMFQEKYDEAKKRVIKDVLWGKSKSPNTYTPIESRISTASVYVRRDFNASEVRCWAERFIALETLKTFRVFPVDDARFNNMLYGYSVPDNPMFAFIFEEDAWKLYTPDTPDRSRKFRMWNIHNIVEGYHQLPAFGRSCILNSSLKDTMTNFQLGEPGCNPPGEGILKPLLNILPELDNRFDTLYCLLDNDPTGKKFAQKLVAYSNWKVKPLWIPEWLPKDPNDFVVKYGYGAWNDVLRRLKHEANPVQKEKERMRKLWKTDVPLFPGSMPGLR